MQIPLQVYWFAGGLRIVAHFLIQCDEPHIFGSVKAVVDTGSPTTIIGTADMNRMRVSKIQLRNLQTRRNPVAIGGGNLQTKIVKNAKITFGGEFESAPIDVCIPSYSDEGGSCQVTILGVDFMQENKLTLFFDPINKEAYFETLD